jgi:hypothetical protein
MSPASCVKFHFLQLRSYARHCKTFRDAEDAADLHYSRHVLTPAAWREWKRSLVKARMARLARECHKKQAQKRFIAQLRFALLIKAHHAQQLAFADQYRDRVIFVREWHNWKGETSALLQQRVRSKHQMLRVSCALML